MQADGTTLGKSQRESKGRVWAHNLSHGRIHAGLPEYITHGGSGVCHPKKKNYVSQNLGPCSERMRMGKLNEKDCRC